MKIHQMVLSTVVWIIRGGGGRKKASVYTYIDGMTYGHTHVHTCMYNVPVHTCMYNVPVHTCMYNVPVHTCMYNVPVLVHVALGLSSPGRELSAPHGSQAWRQTCSPRLSYHCPARWRYIFIDSRHTNTDVALYDTPWAHATYT